MKEQSEDDDKYLLGREICSAGGPLEPLAGRPAGCLSWPNSGLHRFNFTSHTRGSAHTCTGNGARTLDLGGNGGKAGERARGQLAKGRPLAECARAQCESRTAAAAAKFIIWPRAHYRQLICMQIGYTRAHVQAAPSRQLHCAGATKSCTSDRMRDNGARNSLSLARSLACPLLARR